MRSRLRYAAASLALLLQAVHTARDGNWHQGAWLVLKCLSSTFASLGDQMFKGAILNRHERFPLAQFTQHAGPRAMLLATAKGASASGAGLDLVEASPHDFFWGRGVDNTGANHLGCLLMRLRDELLESNNTVVAPTVYSVRPHGLASTAH